jgi:hypothetical protein
MTTLSVTLANVEEKKVHHVQSSGPERGRIVTGQLTPAEGRQWVLTWDLVGATTVTAIETALTATFGGAMSMVWTAPGETDPTRVRFAEGAEGYTKEQVTPGTYRVTVTLNESIENQPV